MNLAHAAGLSLVPLLAAAGTRGLAGHAVRSLPPALVTRLLTAYALTVSLAAGLMLCMTAYFGTVELVPGGHPDDWSTDSLRRQLPIPDVLAVAAGVLATVLLVRAGLHVLRIGIAMHRTTTALAALPAIGELVVLDDATVQAFAAPGWRRTGRVVVSRTLLQSLSATQRRALIAHERAHLHRHHHLYAQAVRLAAAANPLMRRVVPEVDAAIERWADSIAAREVGDPVAVAHAIGIAALARAEVPPPTGLAAARIDVLERVRALVDPPERRLRSGIGLLLATALCWVSVALVAAYAHGIVELAERVQHR